METVEAGTVVISNTGALTGTGSFIYSGSGDPTGNMKQVTDVVGKQVTLKSKAATRAAVQDGAPAASFSITIDDNGKVFWTGAGAGNNGADTGTALVISNLQAGKAQ